MINQNKLFKQKAFKWRTFFLDCFSPISTGGPVNPGCSVQRERGDSDQRHTALHIRVRGKKCSEPYKQDVQKAIVNVRYEKN